MQSFADYYLPDCAHGREELDLIVKLVKRTVEESRSVIADLRPTVLDDFGLSTGLRLQIDKLQAEGWQIDYEETLGDVSLPAATETALFRIVQEALTNVRKHARTSRQIRVTLRHREHASSLRVRDWGCGFRQTDAAEGGAAGEKVGLASMRERVALLGGSFKVISLPGKGTLVAVKVPRLQDAREVLPYGA